MRKILHILALLPISFFAQDYTSFFTGDVADVSTNHLQGTCLMGGASEDDEAMRWFLQRADGGDVVVLRASGSDGYNNYFFSELGVTINSVETLRIENPAGAIDPYVLQQVENAEAIWFAGGDQFDYVSYFKDTAMETALNNFVNVKGGVIGGTSAGMAIMGSSYFDAENGTVTNAQALVNPYANRVSLGYNDFLEIPYLENVITDTHYDDPDRRGRHSVFIARIFQDLGVRSFGIACEEFTAVCIDENGLASIYGAFPSEDDFAYFIQPNCENGAPEVCQASTPLTWTKNNDALRVYKVPGTQNGDVAIDLNTWEVTGTGDWEHWVIEVGNFSAITNGQDPACAAILGIDSNTFSAIKGYPNPFSNSFRLTNAIGASISVYTITGVLQKTISNYNGHEIQLIGSSGIYFVSVTVDGVSNTFELVKE